MEWYIKVLKNYTEFEGRAHRKEYWMFVLFNFIISFILGLMVPELVFIYNLGVFLPGLAVGIRRLHDTGRSGWWLFISLIPLIGAIILLIYLLEDSESGANQYGPNVKENDRQSSASSLESGDSEKSKEKQEEAEVKFCSNCGEKVNPGDVYCKNCGNKVDTN